MPGKHIHQYVLYGLAIESEMALTLPSGSFGAPAQISIACGDPELFAAFAVEASGRADPAEWQRHQYLPDGSTYMRWHGVGEFLVSADGSSIDCRRFPNASDESFQLYLVQRALSFALVRLGLEPLHSTAVVVDGRAIAFLGHGGYGKSSLAAAFLQAGHQLLTDDLLLVQSVAGAWCGHPGPPRIKLFPRVARQMLGPRASGVPMNPDTGKLVMPLDHAQAWHAPAPLAAFYVLPPPRSLMRSVNVTGVEPRLALLEIVRHTFNYLDRGADRLRRQFVAAWRVASAVPVKRLCFPRRLHRLGDLRQAVLADLERS